jgi:endo-beta-N-acetylglucosaminidase D
MEIKSLLFTAVLSLTAAINASAQQPLNLCCHPDDIKNWTPGANADDAFNVAKVPLAKRFQEPTLMKANVNQYYGGEVCNSTILFPTCSLCPSQGANNYTGYQPTYWQYLDKLVYWAGAASEGIINIPPAASTDAAHAQGVKSIGNIFFPPYAFGGNQAWVRQMLTVENGHYIYAQKLYELCKYFNFDGWFINEETGGGSTSEWVGFFKEFYASAAADGNTTVELQWYNASGRPNTDILSTNINTSQFLEYGSVGDYRYCASSNWLHSSPDHVEDLRRCTVRIQRLDGLQQCPQLCLSDHRPRGITRSLLPGRARLEGQYEELPKQRHGQRGRFRSYAGHVCKRE